MRPSPCRLINICPGRFRRRARTHVYCVHAIMIRPCQKAKIIGGEVLLCRSGCSNPNHCQRIVACSKRITTAANAARMYIRRLLRSVLIPISPSLPSKTRDCTPCAGQRNGTVPAHQPTLRHPVQLRVTRGPVIRAGGSAALPLNTTCPNPGIRL